MLSLSTDVLCVHVRKMKAKFDNKVIQGCKITAAKSRHRAPEYPSTTNPGTPVQLPCRRNIRSTPDYTFDLWLGQGAYRKVSKGPSQVETRTDKLTLKLPQRPVGGTANAYTFYFCMLSAVRIGSWSDGQAVTFSTSFDKL